MGDIYAKTGTLAEQSKTKSLAKTGEKEKAKEALSLKEYAPEKEDTSQRALGDLRRNYELRDRFGNALREREITDSASGQTSQILDPEKLSWKEKREMEKRIKEARKHIPGADLSVYDGAQALQKLKDERKESGRNEYNFGQMPEEDRDRIIEGLLTTKFDESMLSEEFVMSHVEELCRYSQELVSVRNYFISEEGRLSLYEMDEVKRGIVNTRIISLAMPLEQMLSAVLLKNGLSLKNMTYVDLKDDGEGTEGHRYKNTDTVGAANECISEMVAVLTTCKDAEEVIFTEASRQKETEEEGQTKQETLQPVTIDEAAEEVRREKEDAQRFETRQNFIRTGKVKADAEDDHAEKWVLSEYADVIAEQYRSKCDSTSEDFESDDNKFYAEIMSINSTVLRNQSTVHTLIKSKEGRELTMGLPQLEEKLKIQLQSEKQLMLMSDEKAFKESAQTFLTEHKPGSEEDYETWEARYKKLKDILPESCFEIPGGVDLVGSLVLEEDPKLYEKKVKALVDRKTEYAAILKEKVAERMSVASRDRVEEDLKKVLDYRMIFTDRRGFISAVNGELRYLIFASPEGARLESEYQKSREQTKTTAEKTLPSTPTATVKEKTEKPPKTEEERKLEKTRLQALFTEEVREEESQKEIFYQYTKVEGSKPWFGNGRFELTERERKLRYARKVWEILEDRGIAAECADFYCKLNRHGELPPLTGKSRKDPARQAIREKIRSAVEEALKQGTLELPGYMESGKLKPDDIESELRLMGLDVQLLSDGCEGADTFLKYESDAYKTGLEGLGQKHVSRYIDLENTLNAPDLRLSEEEKKNYRRRMHKVMCRMEDEDWALAMARLEDHVKASHSKTEDKKKPFTEAQELHQRVEARTRAMENFDGGKFKPILERLKQDPGVWKKITLEADEDAFLLYLERLNDTAGVLMDGAKKSKVPGFVVDQYLAAYYQREMGDLIKWDAKIDKTRESEASLGEIRAQKVQDIADRFRKYLKDEFLEFKIQGRGSISEHIDSVFDESSAQKKVKGMDALTYVAELFAEEGASFKMLYKEGTLKRDVDLIRARQKQYEGEIAGALEKAKLPEGLSGISMTDLKVSYEHYVFAHARELPEIKIKDKAKAAEKRQAEVDELVSRFLEEMVQRHAAEEMQERKSQQQMQEEREYARTITAEKDRGVALRKELFGPEGSVDPVLTEKRKARLSFLEDVMEDLYDETLKENPEINVSPDADLGRYMTGLREYFAAQILEVVVKNDTAEDFDLAAFKEEFRGKIKDIVDDGAKRQYIYNATTAVTFDDAYGQQRAYEGQKTAADLEEMILQKEGPWDKKSFEKMTPQEKNLFALALTVTSKGGVAVNERTTALLQSGKEEEILAAVTEAAGKFVEGEDIDGFIDYDLALSHLQKEDSKEKGVKYNKAAFDEALEFTKLLMGRRDEIQRSRSVDKKVLSDGATSIVAANKAAGMPQLTYLKEKDISTVEDFRQALVKEMEDPKAKVKKETKERFQKLVEGDELWKLVEVLQDRNILDFSDRQISAEGSEKKIIGHVDEEKRMAVRGFFLDELMGQGMQRRAEKPGHLKKAILSALSFQLRDDVNFSGREIKKEDFSPKALERNTVFDWDLIGRGLDMLDEITKEQNRRKVIRRDFIKTVGNEESKKALKDLEGFEKKKGSYDREMFENQLGAFINQDFVKGSAGDERAALLAGYYALDDKERALFFRALEHRDVLDISKVNLYWNIVGRGERDYVNPEGRDALIDEFMESSRGGTSQMTVGRATVYNAMHSLLSTQMDDSMDFLQQGKDIEDYRAGEKMYLFQRKTAIDWKLFARALQLVHRAKAEMEMTAGDMELHRAMGDIASTGRMSMDTAFMRQNIHRTGSRFLRFVGKEAGDKVAETLQVDTLQGIAAKVLSVETMNRINSVFTHLEYEQAEEEEEEEDEEETKEEQQDEEEQSFIKEMTTLFFTARGAMKDINEAAQEPFEEKEKEKTPLEEILAKHELEPEPGMCDRMLSLFSDALDKMADYPDEKEKWDETMKGSEADMARLLGQEMSSFIMKVYTKGSEKLDASLDNIAGDVESLFKWMSDSTKGKLMKGAEKFGDFWEEYGEDITGYVSDGAKSISAMMDIYQSVQGMRQLDEAAGKTAADRQKDEKAIAKSRRSETEEQKETFDRARKTNAGLTTLSVTFSKDRKKEEVIVSTGAILGTAAKISGDIFGAGISGEALEDIVNGAAKMISFFHHCLADHKGMEDYYSGPGQRQVQAVRDNMPKITGLGARVKDMSDAKLMRISRGFESEEELVNHTGLEMVHALMFSAGDYNPLEETKNVSRCVLAVLGLEDLIGKTDSESAMQIYGKLTS
ncbi:MAG: hypothetical protein K5853_00595 [Lachnospiraceae bacterium]|nr:hypothetical protein [Lachnospiraceae bacterium]